jgi:DNA-binding LacI/PurR family transcriptional regulator
VAAIARLAGVSAPTVSKVLNGRSGVGERTRERVEALLRDHGYRRPDPGATAACVEVVCSAMLSSITVDILRGVEEVASSRDFTVGFTNVYRRVNAGQPWLEPLLLRRPSGVILAFSGITAEDRKQLTDSGIPVVALDPIGDLYPMPSVGASNWSGAVAATRHLIDLGHRRVGVITGPVKDLSSRARLDGFRAALDTAGIPFDEGLMRNGVFTFDQGRKLGLDLLRQPDPPTAVVCGDDLQAFGVYEAARLCGLHIPDELSIVGFDDIDQCAWCAPPMTTVRQPFAEMGATATRLLLALANGQNPQQTHVELPTTLIVRESTAPPRNFHRDFRS